MTSMRQVVIANDWTWCTSTPKSPIRGGATRGRYWWPPVTHQGSQGQSEDWPRYGLPDRYTRDTEGLDIRDVCVRSIWPHVSAGRTPWSGHRDTGTPDHPPRTTHRAVLRHASIAQTSLTSDIERWTSTERRAHRVTPRDTWSLEKSITSATTMLVSHGNGWCRVFTVHRAVVAAGTSSPAAAAATSRSTL